MPAPYMDQLIWHSNACWLHEVDRDQSGNVGDAIVVSGNELTICKLAIDEMQERERLGLVRLTPFRNLWHLPILHRRMDVTESVRHRHQEVQFHTPLPFLHLRASQWTCPEKWLFRMTLFKVAAYRYRFRQHRSIIELKNRKTLQGITVRDLLAPMPQRAHVDRHQRNVDAFLGKKDAHAARIWRLATIKQLHLTHFLQSPLKALLIIVS